MRTLLLCCLAMTAHASTILNIGDTLTMTVTLDGWHTSMPPLPSEIIPLLVGPADQHAAISVTLAGYQYSDTITAALAPGTVSTSAGTVQASFFQPWFRFLPTSIWGGPVSIAVTPLDAAFVIDASILFPCVTLIGYTPGTSYGVGNGMGGLSIARSEGTTGGEQTTPEPGMLLPLCLTALLGRKLVRM